MLVSPDVVVSSHTVDEDDAPDYDFLQRHYLEPQLRSNQQLPEGMTLRRVRRPPRIVANPDYRYLNTKLEHLHRHRWHGEIAAGV